jgi:large subunit ribosomal protein L2
MALKKLKPVTAGTRHRLAPVFDDITETTPEKSLLLTLKKSGGHWWRTQAKIALD